MRDDLISQLQQLQRDLSALLSRLSATLELAARLPPDPSSGAECPRCGLRRPTETLLAEHLENVHGALPADRR
jgi:hypothetical protein